MQTRGAKEAPVLLCMGYFLKDDLNKRFNSSASIPHPLLRYVNVTKYYVNNFDLSREKKGL